MGTEAAQQGPGGLDGDHNRMNWVLESTFCIVATCVNS